MIRTLKQCYYGDKENGFSPIAPFVEQMNEYPDLWKVAQKIEGLICRIGSHAGGIIFVDEPFTKSTALMKTPSGDTITQFDLHDDEKASLIKIDLLSIDALDKIHTSLDLICDYGYAERKPTLRETYESLIGVYNLERNSQDMWKMVWNHDILSLFQMEQQSGIQGIALTHPKSVDDLAVLNSVIRLMAQEKGGETPLEKYTRFKNNINEWYNEMNKYGLTKSEQKLLESVVGISYGIAESQEKIMELVQMPELGGFNLTWADKLRKSVAKKQPEAFVALEKEFFENAKNNGLSLNLCNYVWKVLIAMSRGYSFNASHTLAYSIVALQEMNICLRFPIIFWNCACLISSAGGGEDLEDEDKTNNYDKIAEAIGKMRSANVNIMPPDINKSSYSFVPDVENNRIYFGLRGLLNVGEEIVANIINNRPYTSVKDFYYRIKPKKQSMISLIKSGAFDNFCDRYFVMAWYLGITSEPKSRITLQNMNGLLSKNLVPEELAEEKKIYYFNKYLKTWCKQGNNYILDDRALNFINHLAENDTRYYDVISTGILNIDTWDKYYKDYMNPVREWMKNNQQEILDSLNISLFKDEWEKYAKGTISAWEMEAMCFYYHEHELAHINYNKYGISRFDDLSEEPVVISMYRNTIPIFNLTRITGTCIAKNKQKGTVSLLTETGVVTVMIRKEQFSLYDKQISRKNPDGTKTIIERSWFNRGEKIIVTGMRRGNTFVAKKYASTPGHTLYHIDNIDGSDLVLRSERYQGEAEEDNE